MSIEDEVRPGVAGSWDRFVGPGPSRIETAGTLSAVVAAVLWGDAARTRGGSIWPRLLAPAVAVDLWGGAWVNNTPACVRWYERPGQGRREHLSFAALHLLHPAVIALLDHAGGSRPGTAATRWALMHYGWMLASAATITSLPRRARLPVALAASGTGLTLDRLLGPSSTAPWFAPVYYTKLLVGHAAGSIWNAKWSNAPTPLGTALLRGKSRSRLRTVTRSQRPKPPPNSDRSAD